MITLYECNDYDRSEEAIIKQCTKNSKPSLGLPD